MKMRAYLLLKRQKINRNSVVIRDILHLVAQTLLSLRELLCRCILFEYFSSQQHQMVKRGRCHSTPLFCISKTKQVRCRDWNQHWSKVCQIASTHLKQSENQFYEKIMRAYEKQKHKYYLQKGIDIGVRSVPPAALLRTKRTVFMFQMPELHTFVHQTFPHYFRNFKP